MDRIERLLSEMEDIDVEVLDPPAEIWQGIESSLTSEAVRRPPAREASTPQVVEYRIDGDDVLVEVDDGWAAFARANEADALAAPGTGLVLWSAIDGEETRALWQMLVSRVRDRQREVSVPLRCDAPDTRRWLEVTISPGADGSVNFRSVLQFEEARPPVALLDLRARRDDELTPVAVCSWCGRGELGAEWLEIEDLVRTRRLLEEDAVPPISHGLCGGCRREMSSALAGSANAD